MNINSISFVVIVKDDLPGLRDTLGTIVSQLVDDDEIIVVDGSRDDIIRQYINSEYSDLAEIRLIRDHGRGVFIAQNMGIISACRPWIWVINSGDRLLRGARRLVDDAIRRGGSIAIHVFSQIAFSNNDDFRYVFYPTETSLWPHQSVIVNRDVHVRHGYYEETFKYNGEQLFFARVRRIESYRIYKAVVSEYLLGGLSDRVDLRHAAEQFQVWREIGHGVAGSIAKAYVLPIAREFLAKILGNQSVQILKTVVFHYYKPLKTEKGNE